MNTSIQSGIYKINGFYRGKVLKHLHHGICKIFIPGIYSPTLSSDPDCLPDAEQASPLFAGSNNGNGVFSYPNIGSTVWCFFANGDQNYPVYFASTLGGQNAFGQHELTLNTEFRIKAKLRAKTMVEKIKSYLGPLVPIPTELTNALIDWIVELIESFVGFSLNSLNQKTVYLKVRSQIDKYLGGILPAVAVDYITELIVTEISAFLSDIAKENGVAASMFSDKHLITSGKAQLEFYESGKISAYVSDPILTEASVCYSNGAYQKQNKDDYVVNRQMQAKIAEQEISNINCQIVMDNHANNGEISSSTYCYYPYTELSTIILTAEQQTIISNLESNDTTKSQCIQNDRGNYKYSIDSVHSDKTIYNKTDIKNKSTEFITIKNSAVAINTQKHNLSGWTTNSITSVTTYDNNYQYIQLGAKIAPVVTVISSDSITNVNQLSDYHYDYDNLTSDSLNTFKQRQTYNRVHLTDDSILISSLISSFTNQIEKANNLQNDNNFTTNENEYSYKYKHNITLIDTTQSKTYTDVYSRRGNSYAGAYSIRNNIVANELLSTHNINNEVVSTIGQSTTVRTYSDKFSNYQGIMADFDNKFTLRSKQSIKISDLSVIDGSETCNKDQEEHLAEIVGSVGKIELTSKYINKKLRNGTSSTPLVDKNDAYTCLRLGSKQMTGIEISSYNALTFIDFSQIADTKNGILTIQFQNTKLGTTSQLQFGADGTIKLNSSTNISLEAPQISIKASTLNIQGGTGDCKIKNVSLLSHSHLEMQTGDIVTAGSTKTKSATQSN